MTREGVKYYSVGKEILHVYFEHSRTPYNPREWCELAGRDDGSCSGIESVRIELRKDNYAGSCVCQAPEPEIVLPATVGWAKCRRCNNLIGTVVYENGEPVLIGRDSIAKRMVEKMLKEARLKKKQ